MISISHDNHSTDNTFIPIICTNELANLHVMIEVIFKKKEMPLFNVHSWCGFHKILNIILWSLLHEHVFDCIFHKTTDFKEVFIFI